MTLKRGWNDVEKWFKLRWKAVEMTLKRGWDFLKKWLKWRWKWLEFRWEGVESTLKIGWKGVGITLKSGWNDVEKGLKWRWKGVETTLKSGWNDVEKWLHCRWKTALKSRLKMTWNVLSYTTSFRRCFYVSNWRRFNVETTSFCLLGNVSHIYIMNTRYIIY